MVFISGPRQVGKTTLAKQLMPNHQQYFNFDSSVDRKAIVRMEWSQEKRLVVLDEIHKMKNWKRWIKGVWDTQNQDHAFVVTGSSRLDFVRKSGESLAGRYFSHRLHPLSLAELSAKFKGEEALDRLLKLGGFPEPFFSNDLTQAQRWRRGHVDRILREDVTELERVSQIKNLEFLIELLSERVSSTISYTSLASDLSISPKTVKLWINILESFYVVFIVTPYSKSLNRAIRKEPKVYFYDVGRVPDEGARLENLVACHLLKRNHYLEDCFGHKASLHFVRDKEKREVDFLTCVDNKVESLIEVKTSQEEFSRSLNYYHQRLKPLRSIQLLRYLKREKSSHGIDLKRMSDWLGQLEV